VIISFTRWFKYDRDDLCVNKSQFVPVIFEPPCTLYVRRWLALSCYCTCWNAVAIRVTTFSKSFVIMI
jgi:hypothetical protein